MAIVAIPAMERLSRSCPRSASYGSPAFRRISSGQPRTTEPSPTVMPVRRWNTSPTLPSAGSSTVRSTSPSVAVDARGPGAGGDGEVGVAGIGAVEDAPRHEVGRRRRLVGEALDGREVERWRSAQVSPGTLNTSSDRPSVPCAGSAVGRRPRRRHRDEHGTGAGDDDPADRPRPALTSTPPVAGRDDRRRRAPRRSAWWAGRRSEGHSPSTQERPGVEQAPRPPRTAGDQSRRRPRLGHAAAVDEDDVGGREGRGRRPPPPRPRPASRRSWPGAGGATAVGERRPATVEHQAGEAGQVVWRCSGRARSTAAKAGSCTQAGPTARVDQVLPADGAARQDEGG